jgi:Holliday junction resolvasome RuvABC endonuclease subunit
MSIIVLGVDPGFASLGYAALSLGAGDAPRLVAMGVVRTQKETARARLLAVEDNVRRTREIIGAIAKLFAVHDVRAIAAESMSFPRSSSVAAKVALVWGALITIAEMRRVPLLQCTPQSVKRWASGSSSCSKEDVAFEVRLRCGNESEALLAGIPNGMHEHAWDAAACALVCAECDLVRALLGRAA